MAMPPIDPSVEIELVSAPLDQLPILANLLELYAHDFSEFHDIGVGDDGRFLYPDLPLYWSEPNRHPMLVRIDGKWAGFALVRKGSRVSDDQNVWDMAEFFVLREFRRRGLGTRIAHEVWRSFPGQWEVRVMQENLSAHQFWQHAIAAFTGNAVHSSGFEKNDESWRLFTFRS
jgi:predicted acetyltransferase